MGKRDYIQFIVRSKRANSVQNLALYLKYNLAINLCSYIREQLSLILCLSSQLRYRTKILI